MEKNHDEKNQKKEREEAKALSKARERPPLKPANLEREKSAVSGNAASRLSCDEEKAKSASHDRKKMPTDEPELRYLPGMLIRYRYNATEKCIAFCIVFISIVSCELSNLLCFSFVAKRL